MDIEETQSVLVLVASNRRRGAEVFGEHLAAGLRNRGWRVQFAALQSVDADEVVDAATLSGSESLGRLDIGTVRSLRRLIKTHAPSIILANGGATLRYAIAAQATIASPPILAYASIGEPTYWLRSGKHARLQRFLHQRADLVFAVSEMTKTQLTEALGVEDHRIHVAYTGVAPEYFVEKGPEHEELRVIYLGSLSAEKDPLVALDVVRALRASHDVRFRMVGDGPLADEVAERVDRESLGDVVTLTGSVSDVTPHLQWADLLILTSRTEGLPGAALEAGAASVPVVAFDVGGTAETMVDGSSGLLVKPGDTPAMVDAIDGLARDPKKLAAMGQEARRFIEDGFTLERAIQRYDGVLSTAVQEAQTP